MNILPGKKTYISAFALFVIGVIQIVSGDVIGGAQRIVEAAGLAGLRNGIATDTGK